MTVSMVPAASAQQHPPLTPRVLVAVQYAPMDLQEEGSIGLIMFPGNLSGADNLWLSGAETEWTIDQHLALNRPDLPESQRHELADILNHSLVGASLNLDNGRFRQVTQGGIEQPWLYYSNVDGAPTRAEFAKAGPDGDIIFLGAFPVRIKTESGSQLPHIPSESEYIVGPNSPTGWDYTIQVAIGWFK